MIDPSFRAHSRFLPNIIGAFACALFAIAGCNSNSTSINQHGTPEPRALTGRIQLYDGTGKAIALDSGVTVAAGSAITSVTADSGSWIISNLATGSYTLTFTKSGFGTVEQFGDSVILNDTVKVPTVILSQPPTDAISFESFQFVAPKSFIFNCKMPAPFISTRTVVLCLSTDSATLATNASQAQWFLATATSGSGYDGSFSVTSDTTIPAASLAHGATIYATVCIAGEGTNYQSFSHYYDPVAMKEMYTALGPHSRMLSVKIP